MGVQKFDIAIIGAGIVGLATAYKFNQQFPNLSVVVLEKEQSVSFHQTGRNSGVIHSGLYYKPGSYKAKNCVDGRRELVKFAKEYNIPHDICGKVVVATDKSELPHMHKVFNNGTQNDVEGIEIITKEQIKEIEPHCEGIEGILVPCTGIIDFKATCYKLEELINSTNNSKVITDFEVINIDSSSEIVKIKSKKGTEIHANNLITCGGLQSDRLAKMEGKKPENAILGFRGDYYDLTDEGKHKVKHLIYPVPNPQFPFLGVHFTRMTDGVIECGPNAVFVFKREGYEKTSFSMKDTLEAIGFKGTWNFFFKHWRFGIDEYQRAFSKRMFLTKLQKLIPSLTMEDIQPGRCGVRAMALSSEGNMIDDFSFVKRGKVLHVLNAPSPAATAALAIGAEICNISSSQFNLK